ncbi:LytR/AlgR family response regulator transcription factor [Agathobaculum sp.]|uniref:LytR/AlgR family response regulator transcription factor n=1 Tax=Agathobaculum sp. TaxID=2048138 RepID=UPI0027B9C91E|nr:LytTR family DNA-binding domain-containing protein [Agathobaculum sp.]
MLKIAACDDESAQLEQMERMLQDYFRARLALPGRISVFSDSRTLLSRVREQGGFDLYILDIIMPGLDGIQTGMELRKMGDGGEIIYLTTSSEYAVDSYTARAFFYLIKPVTEKKLFGLLDEAAEKLQQRRSRGILVMTPDGPRHIRMDHILYAERIGRRVRYYCTDGTVDTQTIRCTFRDAVHPLTEERRFCMCGASFLVNMEHVTGVDGREALLDNGGRLILPRSASSFKDNWGRFWLEEDSGCPIG